MGAKRTSKDIMRLGYIAWRFKFFCHLFPPTNYLIRKRRHLMESDGAIEEQRCALRERGLEIAECALRALGEVGIAPVLSYGNLLGVVREGAFLAHDDDLDFAFCLTDEAVWPKIEAAMTQAGFEKIRQFEYHGAITEQAYFAEGLGLDIFGFKPVAETGKLRGYFYARYWDVYYPDAADHTVKYCDVDPCDEVKHISVNGYELPVPDNADEWLAVFYGESWRVPNPAWESASGWTLAKDFGQCTLFVR